MNSVAVESRHERREVPAPPLPASAQTGTAIGRIPSVMIHAFTESSEVAAAVESAAVDRRMSRARLTRLDGGIKGATNHYQRMSTPNLIVLETSAEGAGLLAELDALAGVCDVSTRIIVVGTSNDIELYRALMRRGVSEYLRRPVDAVALVSAISGLFSDPAAAKLGRIYAFVGARGGTGSSTLAHNVASMLGRVSGGDVILADLDLAFGTAGMNFDLEAGDGLAEAIREPGRLDQQMFERLLSRCDERLSLLAAPAVLDFDGDKDPGVFEAVLDLAQASVPHIVLDLPHVWQPWTRRTLIAADEVVITATPDLASLRNARNLVAMLRQARPNDSDPRLVLNQVRTPRRPEIKPAEFAEALQISPLASVPFDAHAFGTAANRGRMLAEVRKGSSLAAPLRQIAETLGGRALKERKRFTALADLFRRGRTVRGNG